jgi:hypothetical protein
MKTRPFSHRYHFAGVIVAGSAILSRDGGIGFWSLSTMPLSAVSDPTLFGTVASLEIDTLASRNFELIENSCCAEKPDFLNTRPRVPFGHMIEPRISSD